ncbi:MAG: PspC domain-containing protein [Angelakisella sp.]
MRKKLARSNTNRMVAGICGGLSEFFGIDATIIRIGFVLIGVLTRFFPVLLVYGVLAFVLPENSGSDYNDYESQRPAKSGGFKTEDFDISTAQDVEAKPADDGESADDSMPIDDDNPLSFIDDINIPKDEEQPK